MANTEPNWVAVDWGTTNLRLWLLDAQGQILQHRSSDMGMSRLSSDGYEPVLLDLVQDLLIDDQRLTVVCCGMVGAKTGWVEAPYSKVPCAPAHLSSIVSVKTVDPRLSVYILAGLSQAQPADVMRGEETQIQGFIADNPHWDGVLCLPGTHSKWVHVSAGEVVSFQTYMTGEIFSLLAKQSILRLSVDSVDWDDTAFVDAVQEALSHPQSISARLFSLRAQDILHGRSKAFARATLSGSLLGLELAGAKPYWLGQDVVLVGNKTLCDRYADALRALGAQARVADATTLTIKGIKSAYDHVLGNQS
jgi:2-dehydro-3-deoxygalactonokinase